MLRLIVKLIFIIRLSFERNLLRMRPGFANNYVSKHILVSSIYTPPLPRFKKTFPTKVYGICEQKFTRDVTSPPNTL